MFFVSTPSLIISLVLAVCYLANLAFFAANRQQESDNVFEVRSECVRLPERFVFFGNKSNVRQHKVGDHARAENLRAWHFFDRVASDRDVFRQPLPDNRPVTSDSGIYRKLFFRPPPVV